MNTMEKARQKVMAEIASKIWNGDADGAAEIALKFNVADDAFGALQAQVENAKRDAESLAEMRDQKTVDADRQKAEAQRERLKQEREKFETAHEPKELEVATKLSDLGAESRERQSLVDNLVQCARNPALLPLLPKAIIDHRQAEEARSEADQRRCDCTNRLNAAKARLREVQAEKADWAERGERTLCNSGNLIDSPVWKTRDDELAGHEATAQESVDEIEKELAAIR